MTTTSQRLRTSTLALTTAALLLALTACSGGSETASSDAAVGGGDYGLGAPELDPGAVSDKAMGGTDAMGGMDDSGNLSTTSSYATRTPEASVISTGNIELRADDVAQTRREVQQVVTRYRGQVTQDTTMTDEEGTPSSSQLLVRIPSDDFADAMDDLEGLAVLVSSDRRTEDVTTQVIDIQVRLQVQRRSIERVSVLLDRAENIRDIIAIEGQLAQRQAELEALEQQLAWLTDQTSMSTITVVVDRAEPGEGEDRTGFWAGLQAGWRGLTAVAVGLSTAAGAALPFAVVALVLLGVAWPVGRRVRRRVSAGRTARTRSAASTDQDPSTE